MRSLSLLLFLLGVLTYLFPYYRWAVPVTIPLSNADTPLVAGLLVLAGLALFVWSRSRLGE